MKDCSGTVKSICRSRDGGGANMAQVKPVLYKRWIEGDVAKCIRTCGPGEGFRKMVSIPRQSSNIDATREVGIMLIVLKRCDLYLRGT